MVDALGIEPALGVELGLGAVLHEAVGDADTNNINGGGRYCLIEQGENYFTLLD
jgi:hypothetical protein